MLRLTLTLVLVLSSIALAGCAGFGNTDGGRVEPSTPVPVPATSNGNEANPGIVAPGLTTDNLHDPKALFRHHAKELQNTSVTARRRVTREYLNGTNQSTSTRVVRSNATATQIRYTRMTGNGTTRQVDQWIHEERRYSVLTHGNRTQYRVSSAPDAEARDWWGYSQSFGRLLIQLPVTVGDPVARNMTRVYPIQTTDRQDVASLRNVSFTGRVSERGLVQEYTLSYVTVAGEVPVQVTIEFDISTIGRTTVERPKWVQQIEDASRRTPEVPAQIYLPSTQTD